MPVAELNYTFLFLIKFNLLVKSALHTCISCLSYPTCHARLTLEFSDNATQVTFWLIFSI